MPSPPAEPGAQPRTDIAGRRAERHVQAWLRAWNDHDLDAITSAYSADVRFNAATVTSRWGRPDGWLRGRDELREHFRLGLLNAPALRFTRTGLTPSPCGYLLRYVRDSGTHVAEAVELDAAGKAEHVLVFYDGHQA